MSDIFDRLREPFPKEDIHWLPKKLSSDGTKVLALAHLNARDIMDRLDNVCGPGGWQTRHRHMGGDRIACELGILVDGEWIWKSDGAGPTDVEGDKGAFSDSLKRAAVSFGIGRYLYGLGNTWVPCTTYTGRDGKPRFKEFKASPWEYVRNTEKDQWHGPLGKSDLKKQMQELSRRMNGDTLITTGDLEELQLEYAEVVKQAARDLPEWARGYEKRCNELRALLQVGPPSRETAAAE